MSEAKTRQYIVIDLKSFYASVECVDRDLDPMAANLVVADASRTNKTICLAVSPNMKAQGVRNRCRLFEIPETLEYVVAPPRMKTYMQRSAEIYGVYLRYIAKEDIHVYSIDEAFMDVTGYLDLYGCSARELAERIRTDVVKETGIPATCGLGTNLYLAKVALDITAKHQKDFFGELTEESYCLTLWNHTPITDFWRIGSGLAKRLANMGIHTMGQLAFANEDMLYKEFGVDAELMIDHAWGRESCTMQDIKAYRSKNHSYSSSQVLGEGKSYGEALIVLKEMVDEQILKLVEKRCVASSLTVGIGYKADDEEKEMIIAKAKSEQGEGRVAEHGLHIHWGIFSEGGSVRFDFATNSRAEIMKYVEPLYFTYALPDRTVCRMSITLNGIHSESEGIQQTLFSSQNGSEKTKEFNRQLAISAVKEKFGKNALLKGIDFLPGATARERNAQIGGHRSGE